MSFKYNCKRKVFFFQKKEEQRNLKTTKPEGGNK